MTLALGPLVLGALLSAGGDESFPARRGESGFGAVPDAVVSDRGGARFVTELRLITDRATDPSGLHASPIAMGLGLGHALEVDLSLREGGEPGDARPSPLVGSVVGKLGLRETDGWLPALALGVELDRINGDLSPSARLMASGAHWHGLRYAAFAGAEVKLAREAELAPTLGLGLSLSHRSGLELVGEGVYRSWTPLVGGAVRFPLATGVGLAAGVDWLPNQHETMAHVGVAFWYAPPRKIEPAVETAAPPPLTPEETRALTPQDERPRFRLRIPEGGQ